MEITFNITNIVSENNKIIVFYRFSNGAEFSNRFEVTATALDMIAWGEKEKQRFIVDTKVEERVEELKEELIQE